MWRAKLGAAARHGILTLLISIATYLLVFVLWYPGVFAQLMPGAKLFLLILAVEMVLGPCMSLVIFNPSKSKRELVGDYAVVLMLQLAAYGYGVFSVFESRPAYVVFVKDRLEVVSVAELDAADLREASEVRFGRVPLFGPTFVCVREVSGAKERERLLFDEIPLGKDVQHLPRFYRNCESSEIINNAFDMQALGAEELQVRELMASEWAKSSMVWLPVMGKQGVWMAIFDRGSSQLLGYVEYDPFR